MLNINTMYKSKRIKKIKKFYILCSQSLPLILILKVVKKVFKASHSNNTLCIIFKKKFKFSLAYFLN